MYSLFFYDILQIMKKNISVCLISFLFISLLLSCRTLQTAEYSIQTQNVADEIRIVQISDFHAADFGENEQYLIDAVRNARPDIIALTGDFFDRRVPEKHEYGNVDMLLSAVSSLSPCYFVTGNHEYADKNTAARFAMFEKYGIKILHDEAVSVHLQAGTLVVAGADDPFSDLTMKEVIQDKDYPERYLPRIAAAAQKAELLAQQCTLSAPGIPVYTVLLVHRPEYIDEYLKYDFDLVLSGHTHGGLWRLPPLINGAYAPGQGIFPKYAGGRYNFHTKKGTVMIVSRGLAYKSPAVPRILNSPEVVLVELIPMQLQSQR